MSLSLTVAVICIIYYIVYKYYPYYINWKVNYSIIFIIISYLIIQYFINFEYEFVHKTMKNIYNSNNQPLYTYNSSHSNSNLLTSNTSKSILLSNQNNRCSKCQNIMDISSSYMVYTNPLKYGGENKISNLSLLCNTCYQYHN